jgi:hypothetical protein
MAETRVRIPVAVLKVAGGAASTGLRCILIDGGWDWPRRWWERGSVVWQRGAPSGSLRSSLIMTLLLPWASGHPPDTSDNRGGHDLSQTYSGAMIVEVRRIASRALCGTS